MGVKDLFWLCPPFSHENKSNKRCFGFPRPNADHEELQRKATKISI